MRTVSTYMAYHIRNLHFFKHLKIFVRIKEMVKAITNRKALEVFTLNEIRSGRSKIVRLQFYNKTTRCL